MAKIKHVGLLRFKEGTSEQEIERIFSELMDISENIPGIEDYVSGPNNSPEGLNDGFTHAFVMTFSDVNARDAYLPHPEHERFKASALPHIEKVLVMDFEV
jgi:stress responsive alpha/beta barrel protein